VSEKYCDAAGAEFLMGTSRIVIKKYENRRLYDTSQSKYVNLEEIGVMIRKGIDVQIVDAKTGEDLTRVTLMQVIVENSKDGPTGLPLELLKQLIVASDHVGKEFIMWYMKSAFDAYEKLQGALTSGFSEVQAAAVSPVDAIRKFLRTGAPAENRESGEVEELRRRLAELEKRTQRKPRGKARSTPSSPRKRK
jgi:polyhydroxyalkanoate synthesis repressor PhaR